MMHPKDNPVYRRLKKQADHYASIQVHPLRQLGVAFARFCTALETRDPDLFEIYLHLKDELQSIKGARRSHAFRRNVSRFMQGFDEGVLEAHEDEYGPN